MIVSGCGTSDLPVNQDQQQAEATSTLGPTTRASTATLALQQDAGIETLEGSGPTSTPKPTPSLPVGTMEPNPSATPQQHIETKLPEQNVAVASQQEISAFLQGIGREYPGLLDLPECGESTQLKMAPLADDAYVAIVPLGLLATPQWVLPSSHVYYHLALDTTVSGGYGTPAIAEVRAPGDIRILRVDSSESKGGPQGDYLDYEITFAPCRERMYKLLHVSTMNPQLEALFEATEAERCEEYGSVVAQYRLCIKKFNLDLAVGTIMGNAGGKVSSVLDLEAYDLAGPSLGYANPARLRSHNDLRLKVVCPFDDFSAGLREQQLARMGSDDLQFRTVEPRCGEVMQDIPGAAQGNWYAAGIEGPANRSLQLGLLHDNVDPALGAISIGGIVTNHGVWLFRPETDGLINRDFGDITADGQTYCFQGALNSGMARRQLHFLGGCLLK